jgi:hypothetical protein
VAVRTEELPSAPGRHVVRFYEGEDELVSAVTTFVAEGLASGESAVVVATPEHRAAFDTALLASGVAPARARMAGELIALDAAETLSTFMVGGQPDADRFAAVVGAVIDRASVGGRPVRIYGEMVAELWAAGNRSGAVGLERLWNELAADRDFALYCAYPMAAMAASGDLLAAKGVCDHHSRVMTPPSYAAGATASVAGDGAERSSFFIPVPLAAHAVRRFVIDTLDEWGQSDLTDDAALVVSELASNALLHAESPFRVSIRWRGPVVRLSVHDASCLFPVCRAAPSEVPGGRGVGIVASLARRWGTDPVPEGKVVWAELQTHLA